MREAGVPDGGTAFLPSRLSERRRRPSSSEVVGGSGTCRGGDVSAVETSGRAPGRPGWCVGLALELVAGGW